ncbi:MAG: protein kinase [Planctomycetia bacterium]|nr:protein kinase [Planctomycetia bacterium]
MNQTEFAEFVTTGGLVSADELTVVEKAHPELDKSDAQSLAKLLVQQGKLTKYQAAAIYQGKGKSLVYGDYLVLDRIGAGGMGQVFKVRHRRMDRIVALKVMSQAAIKNADSVRRFDREVRAAAKLTHPNIVHAYDAGVQDGAHYLVIEYVEGNDLSALLRQQQKFPVKQACGFIEQAAHGFAEAHSKGIVHRDVKPGNLLVNKAGVVKVLDMGLARFDDEGIGGAMKEGELTQSGSVMGTVEYMAPEQALDTRHADAKSDVYGLGCTLFRVVTGEPVYAGRTLVEKILAHREQPIPTIRKFRPDAPPALDLLVARMLAKSPTDRPTMQEVADGLATIDFTQSKSGALDIPLAPISTGLPTPTDPTPTGGYAVTQTAHAPLPNVAGPMVRPRTAGAAPPKKKSNMPLLAAAGAGALLLFGGIWIFVKDKDGNNVATIQVPEGGTVQMVSGGAPPAIAPAPVAIPSATPAATQPTASMFTTPSVAVTPTTPTTPNIGVDPADPSVVYVDPARERRAALKIRELGGMFTIATPDVPNLLVKPTDEIPSYPFAVTGIGLNNRKPTDKDMEAFVGCGMVREMTLYTGQLTDAGLQTIAKFPLVDSLQAAGGDQQFTDAGLQVLATMPRLRSLDINGTKITAAGAEALHKKLPQVAIQYPGGTLPGQPIPRAALKVAFRASSEPAVATGSPALGAEQIKITSAASFTPRRVDELFATGPVPDVVKNLSALALVNVPSAADINNGKVEFVVQRDGPLYMGASYAYDGNPSGGDWPSQVTDEAKLKAQGWRPVGSGAIRQQMTVPVQKPVDFPHTIYVRDCKAGETFSIRTRKYNPPVFFVGASAASGIASSPSTPAAPAAIDYALEREVAIALISRGGRVQVKAPGIAVKDIITVDALPTEPFQILEYNCYGSKGVGDQDLPKIRRLSALETLGLGPSQVTDQGLIALQGMPTLKKLNLGTTNVIGSGLTYLVDLPSLETLGFGSQSIDNSAGTQLRRFTNLKHFSLWRTQVSDSAFIASMTKLDHLILNYALQTDFSPITNLKDLRILELKESYVIDADLKFFGSLSKLEHLILSRSDVSDAGLPFLEGLTNLKHLEVSDTYVTNEGAARLRAKLPGCQVSVKTKAGTRPSQRRVPPTPVMSIAAAPVPATNPATIPSATTPAAAQNLSVVCEKLVARTKPVGLIAGGIAFDAPRGNGRSGANGIIVPAPSDWRTAGTCWKFNYTWSLSAHGVIMIHPFAGGHFRITVMPEGADMAPGGPWNPNGGTSVYGLMKKFPMATTADTATVFPLKENITYAVTSRVDNQGNYQLLFDDKVVFYGQVVPTPQLLMKPPFEDAMCPESVPVAHAGLVIGPRDGGTNEAAQVRLTSNARVPATRTTPPAVVASTPTTPTATVTVASTPAVSPVAPSSPAAATPEAERAAAIAVLAKQGKIKVSVNGRETPEITAAASLPTEPFHVVQVSFYQVAAVADQDLIPLRSMPELRHLDLLGTSITDEGLVHLAGLQNLNWLHLTGTNVRGPGIRHLINCPKLTTLRFGDKSLDDSAVPYLAQMKQVESFEAVRSQLSDISWIAPLENLHTLHVGGGSRISDINSVRAKTKLRYLNLWRTFLLDRDLMLLRDLKEMENLNLGETDISDAGLIHLEGLTKLTRLELIDTYVTDAGVAKLRTKLPGCNITIRTKSGSPPAQRRTPPPAQEYAGPASSPAAPNSSSPSATVASAIPSFAPPPSVSKDRKPAPDAAAQQTALKSIKEIFVDDYAAAKTSEQKGALATKLIDQARQTNDDPTSRYVLLGEARTLATDAGVLESLNDALRIQLEEYELDPVSTRLDAWNALLKRPRIESATVSQLAKEANKLVDQATVDAQFDEAKRYGEFALATSRRLANSAAVVKLLVERNAALAARQKDWPTLVAMAEKLKTTPDDAEANLTIARYLALSAEDWPRAFPLFAKSGDPTFVELAAKSLKALDDLSAQGAAGDAWWDAAQTAKLAQKPELLAGAHYWYSSAVPVLSGLAKTRIEKRIADITPQLPTKKIFASTLPSYSDAPTQLNNSGAVPFDQRALPNRTFGEPSPPKP